MDRREGGLPAQPRERRRRDQRRGPRVRGHRGPRAGAGSGEDAYTRMLRETLIGLGAHVRRDFADAAGICAGRSHCRRSSRPVRGAPRRPPARRPRSAVRRRRPCRPRPPPAGRGPRPPRRDARPADAGPPAPRPHRGVGGRWSSASASAEECVELGRGIGQDDVVAHALALRALLAALQGDEERCGSLAAESRRGRLGPRLAHVRPGAVGPVGARARPGPARRGTGPRAGDRSRAHPPLGRGGPDRGRGPGRRPGRRRADGSMSSGGGRRAAARRGRWPPPTAAEGSSPRTRARRSARSRPRSRLSVTRGARSSAPARELALGELLRRARRRVEAREPPARGARGLRGARGRALGGAGAHRAARQRPDRDARRSGRPRATHGAGAAGRAVRRPGPHQSGRRGTALPEPAGRSTSTCATSSGSSASPPGRSSPASSSSWWRDSAP